MASVFGNEVIKTALKWRTYIGFIAIAVLVPVVELAILWEGGAGYRSLTRGLEQDFLMFGNLFNGYFVTQILMNALWVHVPFLISLVAGDQLAGEATAGTFRLLLIRPVSRSAILAAKYGTTLLYTAVLVIFIAVLSLGLGLALFGAGDLLVPLPGRMLVIIQAADVPLRFLLGFALAIVSMWCVASLAFLFSSFVENAIGPIVGTMAVIIVFLIVSNLPVDAFEGVRPWLFTTYLTVWQQAFDQPVLWGEIGLSVAKLCAFSVGFYLIAWYIFVRKDILS
jgi:ABC-2 type transport system permease protein